MDQSDLAFPGQQSIVSSFEGLPMTLAAEWVSSAVAPFLFAGLVLAGLGTITLFCIGLTALHRRRSLPYLLITLALGALVLRTVIGWGTAVGVVPMTIHHFLEHGLDCFVAVLLLGTVYQSRSQRSVRGDDDDAPAKNQAVSQDVQNQQK